MLKSLRRRMGELSISGELKRALIMSQGFAFGWWLVALVVRHINLIPVWTDQRDTFTQVAFHLSDPYPVRLPNPPWTAVLLIPFALPPLPLAVLIQLCLYFAILTLVIFKFKGNIWTVLFMLTSFVALDSALELNVEWLACVGLLVPAAWSGPFLLVKPQVALGVWLSFKRRDLVRALIVALLIVIISLLLWGNWISAIAYNMSSFVPPTDNMAPMKVLPVPVSLGVGAVLALIAFRRRDPALSILAWLFFVPYIRLYSLLLPLGLVTIRWRLLGIIINVAMWLVYGGVVVLYYLR